MRRLRHRSGSSDREIVALAFPAMAVLMAVRLATTVPRLLGGRWLAVPVPT